jgi:SAM-dependent methyltransferase
MRKATRALVHTATRPPKPGLCPVCERRTVFVRTGASSREAVKCLWCRSSPRGRALLTTLDRVVADWPRRAVFEAGTGGGLSDRLARSCPGYTGSLYFKDVPRGDTRDGIRSEDLEALTFAAESFDVVVTQDVLEHVFHPQRAFAEVARVLRPDGVHVFTVPYDPALAMSRTRAEIGPEGVRHLEPPAFHDDLLNPAGVLVVTDWGLDLPALVREWSGLATEVVEVHDHRQGIIEPIQVFVSRRQA